MSLKRGITYIFYHYFAKVKADFYDSLYIEKLSTLRNVLIHIKSVLSKEKNHYHYEILLEKCSCHLAKF